jgi:hypothetical protein
MKIGVEDVDGSEVLAEARRHMCFARKTTTSGFAYVETLIGADNVVCQQRSQATHQRLRDRCVTFSLSSP